MKEVSEYIYQFFTSVTAFTNVMQTKFYPVVADVETPFPFAIYGLAQQTGISKDTNNFVIVLSGYFEQNQYEDCVMFSDAITDVVKATSRLDWQNSEVNFIEENQSFVANITFNIEK